MPDQHVQCWWFVLTCFGKYIIVVVPGPSFVKIRIYGHGNINSWQSLEVHFRAYDLPPCPPAIYPKCLFKFLNFKCSKLPIQALCLSMFRTVVRLWPHSWSFPQKEWNELSFFGNCWLVVYLCFVIHPFWGRIPIVDYYFWNKFEVWNHQPPSWSHFGVATFLLGLLEERRPCIWNSAWICAQAVHAILWSSLDSFELSTSAFFRLK